MENEKEFLEHQKLLENVHHPSGPIYSGINKQKARFYFNKGNNLEAIYCLRESHAPYLRFKASYRYERAVYDKEENLPLPLSKDNFAFDCSDIGIDVKVKKMLEQISSMPKEWTLVQLTSQYNVKEALEISNDKIHTSPLFITVFKCGQNDHPPLLVNLGVPKDVSGTPIPFRQEMYDILKFRKERLKGFKTKRVFGVHYREADDRLMLFISHIQDKWFGFFRYLFVGRLANSKLEEKVGALLNDMLKDEKCKDISDVQFELLKSAIKVGSQRNQDDLKRLLKYSFRDDDCKELRERLLVAIEKLDGKYRFGEEKRHPVILIVDEKLYSIPWEQIDVLLDQPVSRMPSLHIAYALFKEHESTIVDGAKVIADSRKGAYLINPGQDLPVMEKRLDSFISYWCPEWKGLAGVTPSAQEFQDLLTACNIFMYSGHGNGTQFLSSEKIQRLRIDAVILLFGCSSVSLSRLGPQTEMFGTAQMYTITCSPCVVGMLWEVTDRDTDLFTTEFLSQWLPSQAPRHWKYINKIGWNVGNTTVLEPEHNASISQPSSDNQPDLLRALNLAKKAPNSYLTKAAPIALGLPVRIVNS